MPLLFRFSRVRALNLRFPIRVSKCGAIEDGSWPIVSIEPRILFRYASTIGTIGQPCLTCPSQQIFFVV